MNWQVTYNTYHGTAVRDMAIPKGFAPPVKTQWDGKMYHRAIFSMERLSVLYVRYQVATE